MSDDALRPLSILIAALGGEGGGVMTQWIVDAAEHLGFPVQSTSIPGVAQRTGATTYYIEMLPRRGAMGAPRPVFALSPGAGDVDIVLASELLEAGRTIASGFVTVDRTTLIASTSRSYLVTEKMAMADGRFDAAQLRAATQAHAKRALLLDFEAIAKQHRVMINSVMLGVLAGSGALPVAPDVFEAIMRRDTRTAESNVRGFRAGLEAAGGASANPAAASQIARKTQGAETLEEAVSALPPSAHEFAREGVRRLTAYQDERYAQLYLERLRAMSAVDAASGARGKLVREVARYLAVRMSYEDVIRVAQAKIDPARLARLDAKTSGGAYSITEFLKPGIGEMCSLLPARLGRRILAAAEKRGWMHKHWAMEVRTSTLSGYARFWLLAKLRRWRRGTLRYADENEQIEGWLALIGEGAKQSAPVALEIAECARLIKGYGDTLTRGQQNFRTIEEQVIRPLMAEGDPPRTADAIASARVAALQDPEGESLARCIADIHQRPRAIAAE